MNPAQNRADSAFKTSLSAPRGGNNPGVVNPQGYNTFSRGRHRLSTQRFADVLPIYMQKEIEGNKAFVRANHRLRTDTLNSIVYTDVMRQQSFFQVPWSAILPNSWEALYREPIEGEDITYIDVAPVISIRSLLSFVAKHMRRVTSDLSTSALIFGGPQAADMINAALSFNLIFGNNSLLKNLGCSLPFRKEFDDLYSRVVDMLLESQEGYVTLLDSSGYPVRIPIQEITTLSQAYNYLDDYVYTAFEAASTLMQTGIQITQHPYGFGSGDGTTPTWSGYTYAELDNHPAMKAFVDDFIALVGKIEEYIDGSEVVRYIDLKPVMAYQSIVHQFFTDPNIDSVFTSKMYFSNLRSMILDSAYPSIQWTANSQNPFGNMFRSGIPVGFNQNGNTYNYDAFAGVYLAAAFPENYYDQTTLDYDRFNLWMRGSRIFAMCSALFGIARSMKQGDYFTSLRTRPLAVGNVDIQVSSSNKVSVIDVNSSLWVQRFLNAVNRIPSTIYDYIKKLTGVEPSVQESRPNFIVSETVRIGGMEVENTAENQGDVVTLFRSSDSRNMYEVFIDEPSFIIGLSSFYHDVCYPDATDKIFFMDDRLQWFNHFLQHAGDQTVLGAELATPINMDGYDEDSIVGFSTRYSEFRNSFSEATGAFASGDLPTWAILYERPKYNALGRVSDDVISPAFIRFGNHQIDLLFKSITGKNNASRYHFVIDTYFDDVVNSRQAAFPGLDG